MPADIFQHTYPNGLTLLAERMDYVRSAAVNFLVPAGCIHDPPARAGISGVLADMLTRGAGSRDSRALALALDNLGLDRSESAGSAHLRLAGATLARNLPQVLEIYADIILRPHLPAPELEPVRSLALQELAAIEDEPRQKVMLELRKRYFPAPLSYDRRGTAEGLAAITPDDVREHFEKNFHSNGAIISVAGNIEWEPLKEQVGKLFSAWKPGAKELTGFGPSTTVRDHIHKETTQTQIGIAYESVPIGHPDYYRALGAVNVLSGGMSSRLFTHVREERGLCYAVWASYSTFKDRGTVFAYAGTTTERAQETLDVTLGELKRLVDGIEADEVRRVQAGLKSSLIMQEESTGSRAASLASDWYYLGRVRSFDEIKSAIESLSAAAIIEHLRQHPPKNFTVITLGQNRLSVAE